VAIGEDPHRLNLTVIVLLDVFVWSMLTAGSVIQAPRLMVVLLHLESTSMPSTRNVMLGTKNPPTKPSTA
jgi:hypothetical protein